MFIIIGGNIVLGNAKSNGGWKTKSTFEVGLSSPKPKIINPNLKSLGMTLTTIISTLKELL